VWPRCCHCACWSQVCHGCGVIYRDKIDRSGVPDTIFAHADNFLAGVANEFKGGLTRLYMRINFANDHHLSVRPETSADAAEGKLPI